MLGLTNLVTTVADGVMHLVTARCHLDRDVIRHQGARHGRDKAMLGVMAMDVSGKAWLAEVKVLASSAVNKLVLGKF